MKYILKLAQRFLTTYYAYMIEYRAELFLWALSGSLPFILMGIWMKASQTADIQLNAVEFARYFLAAYIVRQSNVVWVIWEFEKEVVQGKLSFRLLQPIDPVWHHFLSHISERFARFPFIFGLILLFFALYPQSFWIPSLQQFLIFFLFLILSFSLRFIIQYTFALCSFWIERAGAIEEIWSLPYAFLSGMIAPLDVFPPVIREVVLWTPFPYLIYVPASILVGFPVDWVRAILTMLFWGILFFIINRWLWRKGLKQYSGMGA